MSTPETSIVMSTSIEISTSTAMSMVITTAGGIPSRPELLWELLPASPVLLRALLSAQVWRCFHLRAPQSLWTGLDTASAALPGTSPITAVRRSSIWSSARPSRIHPMLPYSAHNLMHHLGKVFRGEGLPQVTGMCGNDPVLDVGLTGENDDGDRLQFRVAVPFP
jgi:hypothetical protein